MEKSIIVAFDRKGAIGRGGTMPWHLKGDLKHFKAETLGFPVIMGRRTFESIGRPLPGRQNIVVSSTQTPLEGIDTVKSLEEALTLAGQSGAEKCFVMGGGMLYKAALPLMDSLVITHIDCEAESPDTFFPEIDPQQWEMVEKSSTIQGEGDDYPYCFARYRRL